MVRRAWVDGPWHVLRFEPGVPVTHYHPLHSRRVPPALRVVTRHALLTYAAKHWPSWQFRVLGAVVALESLARGTVAHCCGLFDAAAHYRRLSALVGDLLAGRTVRARQHLLRSAEALPIDPES